MATFTVNFQPLYPVPCGLVINADTKKEALSIARKTVKHCKVKLADIKEFTESKGVVFYASGDY